MEPTFKLPGDVFNVNWLGQPARGKWIHTVGAVARTDFVSNGNHGYTGILQGADNCLIRLSAAKEPSSTG